MSHITVSFAIQICLKAIDLVEGYQSHRNLTRVRTSSMCLFKATNMSPINRPVQSCPTNSKVQKSDWAWPSKYNSSNSNVNFCSPPPTFCMYVFGTWFGLDKSDRVVKVDRFKISSPWNGLGKAFPLHHMNWQCMSVLKAGQVIRTNMIRGLHDQRTKGVAASVLLSVPCSTFL